jgi:AraC-like DNA-binding protein/mannose-6-phosphate isomerase-like protein (cupin superfamily)
MGAIYQPFPILPGRRAQVWRHRSEYRRPRHFHEEPEINLVVRGAARIGIGDGEAWVSAGDMLVFQPGQDHVLLDEQGDLELYVLALAPALAERVLGRRALSACQRLTLPPSELERLAGELSELGDVHDAVVVERRIGDCFALALARSKPRHVVARRALEQVRSDPSLSGAALARRTRVSTSTLSERFRLDLGLPLVEYRARMKLMRFVELVDRGMPQSRAALEAEFGSYAQCHRVFRRLIGCAPREYFRGRRTFIDDALATPNSSIA